MAQSESKPQESKPHEPNPPSPEATLAEAESTPGSGTFLWQVLRNQQTPNPVWKFEVAPRTIGTALSYWGPTRAHQATTDQTCLSCHTMPHDSAHPGHTRRMSLHAALPINSLNGLWIGLDANPVEEPLRSQLSIPEGQGLVVTFVHGGSPAERSGVKQHDVLLTVGDTPLGSVAELQQAVERTAETPLRIVVLRAGKKVVHEVQPDRQKVFLDLAPYVAAGIQSYRLGIRTAAVDDTLRSQLGLTDGRGIVVTEVIAETPAERAGFHVHDVLISANDKPLKELDDLRSYLQEIAAKPVNVKLIRAGKTIAIETTAELHSEPNANTEVAATPLYANYYQLNSALLLDGRSDSYRVQLSQSAASPDLEGQLAALVEQSKQLAAAIEALAARVKK